MDAAQLPPLAPVARVTPRLFCSPIRTDTVNALVVVPVADNTLYNAPFDHSDFVAAVDKAAYADGVTGTPTLTVNGKVLELNQITDFTP